MPVGVSQAYGVTPAGSGESPAIRGEGDGEQTAVGGFERGQEIRVAGAVQVPQPDGVIDAADGERGTNWVRAVITVPNATSTVTKGIRRLSSQPDGHGGWPGFYEQYETDPAAGSSFGMQVYAPRSTCIFASSVVKDASGQIIAFTGTGIPYDPWVAIC